MPRLIWITHGVATRAIQFKVKTGCVQCQPTKRFGILKINFKFGRVRAGNVHGTTGVMLVESRRRAQRQYLVNAHSGIELFANDLSLSRHTAKGGYQAKMP